ncbi:MAG: glycosyltransferase [Paludibacteraceae bacterium]|nr:glycosyltransferase [Paludibacteraceae bacterium]
MNLEQPLISIVVPVYNVEAYLDRCVQSVEQQSYQNWELLLIDDGSSDRSAEICDNWNQKDSRIRVFHKRNGGVSSARNSGLDNAKGDYLMFVDADDWLSADALQQCETLVEKDKLDALLFGWNSASSNSDLNAINVKETEICDFEQFFDSTVISGNLWLCFFRRDIIEQNSLHFNEKMKYAEDQLFLYSYLTFCERIKSSNLHLYYYYNRPGSAMNNMNYSALAESMLLYDQSKVKYPKISRFVDRHNLEEIMNVLDMNAMPYRQIKNLYHKLHIDIKNISNPSHRIFVRVSWFGFFWAVLVLNAFHLFIRRDYFELKKLNQNK